MNKIVIYLSVCTCVGFCMGVRFQFIQANVEAAVGLWHGDYVKFVRPYLAENIA